MAIWDDLRRFASFQGPATPPPTGGGGAGGTGGGDEGDQPMRSLGEAAQQLRWAAGDLQASARELNSAAAAITFAARSSAGSQGGQGGNLNLGRGGRGLRGLFGGRRGRGGLGRAAGAGLGRAAQALRAGQGLGGALRAGLGGAGQALGGAGGAAAGAAGGLLAVGSAAVQVVQGLNQLSQESISYARTLSQASAAMAGVFAERNVRELLRNMEKGDRLASSARGLTQAEQDVADNTKEIEILYERAKMGLAAGWERLKAEALRPFNDMARSVNKVVENTDPNKGVESILMGEWVKAVSEEDHRRWERRREHGMPPDRGGPKKPDWLPDPR